MSNTQGWIARFLSALVAFDAMLLSYHALALRAGGQSPPDVAPGLLAWLYPITVDGLLAMGMLAGYVLRRARLRTRAYVWAVIGLGLLLSLLGNSPAGLIPGDTLALRVFPPVALALALHLLIVLTRDERPRAGRRIPERTAEVPPPALAPEPASVRPLVLKPSATRSPSSIALELLTAEPSTPTAQVTAATGLSDSSVRRIRADVRALRNGRAESGVSG